MNILRSYFNKMANNWPIAQNKLRTIHETLLECLGEENVSMGRQDYKPGKVHLIEKNVWNGSSVLLRLLVSRNDISILRAERSFPENIILKTPHGKYQIVDGLHYQVGWEKNHIPYKRIPYVLEEFANQHNGIGNDSRIQFSLITE